MAALSHCPTSAGIRLKSSSLQTLLYLCSGGDEWHLRVAPPLAPPEAAGCAPLEPSFLEAFPEACVEPRASNPPDQAPAEPMQASDGTGAGSMPPAEQQAKPAERPLPAGLTTERAASAQVRGPALTSLAMIGPFRMIAAGA